MDPLRASGMERDWSEGKTFQSVVTYGNLAISRCVTERGTQGMIESSNRLISLPFNER